ncbi:DGQHR domain-containing protein [Crocosphaera sp. XPORK-15E]|uniref:DGQHR domain-containing protein n=1 Tax=Crocosphaera sp. XPORK-15E TaxID=3110247 RepID=UPI002B1ED9B5|nr:DGQHR domain-containing protein [Crocosphaera sp. XPORK-15E]MEA5533155.1 DGQHR domain-containing protein [Crocosphaera sp. XPORK-15E]
MDQNLTRQLLQQDTEEKEALALLLERHLSRQEQIFVQKTQMGNTQGYLGSVSLEWLASRVRFASQLPLFRRKYDPITDNIIRDAETVEELQQRPLDWSRQAHLAQYLAVVRNHKFPPVLVVISSGWVNDPHAVEWGGNRRALVSVDDFTSLDQQDRIGLINIGEDYSIFALDGQHRLMGIQGLMELLKTGKLEVYNKYKKATGSMITIDDLIEEYHLDVASLQSLSQEKIGIEIIPAVIQGETYEEARRRVRSIFVHVNRMAISLSKGQLVLLNEDDGFAIISRRLAITHSLLKDRDEHDWNPRVNWDSATISNKSTVLTTLQALQDMAEGYLGDKFSHWKNKDKKNLIALRPDDQEIEEGLEDLQELFDYLASLPSYRQLEQGVKSFELRRFSHETGGGEGNMLFRPVGQIALIQALGFLVFRKEFDLKTIFKKLIYFDEIGGFSNMENSQSLWYGILYDPMKKRIQVSGKKLASRLFIYLLGGVNDEFEKAEIRKALAEARTIKDAATNQEKTIDFQGKFVKPRSVGLPDIL